MELRHSFSSRDRAGNADLITAASCAHFGDVLRIDHSQEVPTSINPYLNSTVKRVLDVTLAALLLIAVCPLALLIAVAIKATSRGPIIFRQKRHSDGRKVFEIFKFRSMRAGCEKDPLVRQAVEHDERVTYVGRFIRKTSLDELPQLINVLRGDMSLVGPRPHAIVHDEKYLAEIPLYKHRFSARAGITGLAQVSGARGATPRLSDMQRRVQYDLEYISSASLLLDIKILLWTAITELSGRTRAF